MKIGDKRIKLTAEETALLRELNDADDYGEPNELHDEDSQQMINGMLAEKYNIDLEKNLIMFTDDYKTMLIMGTDGNNIGSSTIEEG